MHVADRTGGSPGPAALLAISRAKRLSIQPDASPWGHPKRPVLGLAQDPLRRMAPDLDRFRAAEIVPI